MPNAGIAFQQHRSVDDDSKGCNHKPGVRQNDGDSGDPAEADSFAARRSGRFTHDVLPGLGADRPAAVGQASGRDCFQLGNRAARK